MNAILLETNENLKWYRVTTWGSTAVWSSTLFANTHKDAFIVQKTLNPAGPYTNMISVYDVHIVYWKEFYL